MMSGNRKYRGAFWRAAIQIVLYGVLTGMVLEIVLYYHWAKAFSLGLLVSAGIVFFARTAVELSGDRICIRGAGHRECFDIQQFAYPSIRRKEHIGSYSKFVTVKCYLIFVTPDGYRRCRLRGFGERDLEKVLEAVRNAQAEYLTGEEKAAVVEEYRDEFSEALLEGREGSNEFSLPVSVLIMKEKECLRKISLVMTGIIFAAGVLDAYEILVNHTFSAQLLFLSMLAVLLLIFLIVTYAGLDRKKRICAERIVIDGDHLMVGQQYYSYAGIERIRLTSPRRKSDSIFPVQRYMYISAEGRTKKYWLGSEASFESYDRLCRSMERGMVMTPNKLRYK